MISHSRAVLIVAGCALVVGGCRSVPPRFGADPARARATADGLFGSIVTRFDRVFRDSKVLSSRRAISRALLTPSRIFGDTAIWTSSPNATTRHAEWRGVAEPQRYHFTTYQPKTPLARAGESYHDFQLRKVGNDIFEWTEDAHFGVGEATPAAIAGIPAAWLAAGERADTAAIRADIHAAFARSAETWGRLVSLDRIATARDPSGAWAQTWTIRLRPERAKIAYPAFANWLTKFVGPLRLRLRLHDATRTWFDVSVRDNVMTVKTRTQDGRLLPLEGGSMAMPDSVSLYADASMKFSVFRIGFEKLSGAFVTIRRPEERGWIMRFRTEPDWELPLLTEQMLRTPLKRPFLGDGSYFRIVAQRESDGPQTFISRKILLTVQESAILRFVARLANRGVDAYISEGADRDLSRFMRDGFGALQADSRQVLLAR
jgi:hypothetical protein